VLADVEEKALQQAVEGLTGGGTEAVGVVTDVSKWEQVDALAERAYAEFGAVHLVHNNAGVGAGGLMWELSDADWQWVLGVNLWGVIYGIRAFVPRMIASGEEAHVVNTASMAGLTTPPFMGPYNVSKHSVVAISEGLHKELAMTGAKVKVSVLCPGFVNTRIGESSRNRPDELQGGGDGQVQDLMRGEMFRQLLESGLTPDEVAGHVMDAVKADRFYILTHPDMKDSIRSRMEGILAEENPGTTSFL
jgi:NAD(P)-dependent dehydrogenase (short-subunit alcohol dehydrogenase family)